jgi:transposase, IS6 family
VTTPFEVMRALRKGQAAIFNLTRDMRGEARIFERAFGIGPCRGYAIRH